jgi:glycosyltransferase involved in cell wall biosynthesis
MKVAYIVSLFPKISETFILREILALKARGVDVLIVSLKSRREAIVHPEASDLSAATIDAPSADRAAAALMLRLWRQPIVTLTMIARVTLSHALHPTMLVKALPLLAAAAYLGDELKKRGVHRVHAHWATYPSLVAWAIRRFEGIPYSITAHAHDIFLPNPLLAAKIEESGFTVTISGFNRDHIAGRCGPRAAAKIRVVHCGVPLEQFRLRDAPPSGPPRLVSVGRMVEYKGFPTLLKAVATLRGRGRDVRLDVIGDGPLEGMIRDVVRDLKLDGSVRLMGARTQEEVRSALVGATSCVLACERGRNGEMDGIPVVLMEAMALGVPVVSTSLSGIPEIVEDGRTGLLAAPGNPGSLAAAVDRVIQDPALASRLAAAGRLKVEAEFDVARSAETLHALFDGRGDSR